jgi:hypothetical protein
MNVHPLHCYFTSPFTFKHEQYADGEATAKFNLCRQIRKKPTADGVDIGTVLMQLWSPTDPVVSTRMVNSLGWLFSKPGFFMFFPASTDQYIHQPSIQSSVKTWERGRVICV